jgi:hypothetical protein
MDGKAVVRQSLGILDPADGIYGPQRLFFSKFGWRV